MPCENANRGLSEQDFLKVRDLIYTTSGIYFQDNKRHTLASRLFPRVRERQCANFEEYIKLLRFDAWRDKEMNAMLNLVTTNETYFFRDDPQLHAFMDTVIPQVIEANEPSKTLKLWSAACSTGDEPYTLALLLSEHAPLEQWSLDGSFASMPGGIKK